MVSKSIKSISTALAIGCAVFAASAGPSQAGLIHDLSTDFGSGQIEFTTISGTGVSGVVAFSFVPIAAATFDINDISSIDWSIDDTWKLSLNLLTNTKIFGSGPDFSQIFLTSDTGSPAGLVPCTIIDLTVVDNGSWFCLVDPSFDIPQSAFIGGSALLPTAIHVPEPAAVATFLLGLAGVGVARRRRTMKAAA